MATTTKKKKETKSKRLKALNYTSLMETTSTLLWRTATTVTDSLQNLLHTGRLICELSDHSFACYNLDDQEVIRYSNVDNMEESEDIDISECQTLEGMDGEASLNGNALVIQSTVESLFEGKENNNLLNCWYIPNEEEDNPEDTTEEIG